ncbi:MAG: CDP-glucose 4,6-dehydratase [Aeromicrobium sp.]
MTQVPMPAPEFWAGRRVLLTGHTGFKGAWLTAWLSHLGADVIGLSLPGSPASPRLWDSLSGLGIHEVDADIAAGDWLAEVADFEPELVLHLAAQSLVPTGYREPLATFRTNVLGTAQVLQFAHQTNSVAASLIVTTDKVYDPRQRGPHAESDFLGGADPYAASKAAAELVVSSWPKGSTRVATARAGNVIGGGDWSDDRLVPDLVRAWSAGNAAALRMPDAVRPWQHVLQPLHGYLLYAERLMAGDDVPDALNFGPEAEQVVPVGTLVAEAAVAWERHGGVLPTPSTRSEPAPGIHETGFLAIDSALAGEALRWHNLLDWETAIDWTIEFYRAERPVEVLMREQIERYGAFCGAQ